MVVQLDRPEYETKPIDCWPRMKELRRWRFHNNWEARSRGDLVITGMPMSQKAICAGFGTGQYADMSYSPYYGRTSRDHKEVLKLLEFVDSKGYGPQVCGALKLHLGQLLKGMTTISPSGETVIPDLVYQVMFCPQVARLGHIVANYLGIPYVTVDSLETDTPQGRDYLVAQLQENIEQMEKITGMKYDDEKLIEATKCEWQSISLFSQICELNKAIPAPLDSRHLMSLGLPATTLGHTKDAVQFYETLLDEVKYRVQKGISARGFERKRLVYGALPWMAPWLGRYPEKYGAVSVAGAWVNAQFNVDENGKWTPLKSIEEELGFKVRTREDALRVQAGMHSINRKGHALGFHIERTAEDAVGMAENWYCDAIILTRMRDCFQNTIAVLEEKLLARAKGIPVLTYDGVMTDVRQFDPAAIQRRFDTFFEGLGLTKLFTKEEQEREEAA